jgi:tRNA (guanine37-N1)-methyltransferase
MRTLDRSFFRKTVPLSAARVFKPSDISNVRKELMKGDLLVLPRVNGIREVKEQDGSVLKALLLKESVKADGKSLR